MMFFGPKAASPPKKTCGRLDWKVTGIDRRHSAAAEGDAEVGLDPGKGVLLADRDQNVVAGDVDVGLAGRREPAPAALVLLRLHLFEQDPGQTTLLRG